MPKTAIDETPWITRLGPRKVGTDLVVAEVSWTKLAGNPGPYFSVTGTVYGRERIRGEATVEHDGVTWWSHSCGCVHDTIAAAFPEITPMIRWHLCDARGPMHYRANGLYWAEKMFGVSQWKRETYDPDPADTFARHVVLGAIEGETMPTAPPLLDSDVDPAVGRALVAEHIGAWLDARHAALLDVFARDLAAFKAAHT